MTEHIKEQISVFIDDELSHEECEFFVRRLQRDDESRSQYLRYQVIGAAIRGEHIFPHHADLRARLQLALDEPERNTTTKLPGKTGFGLRLAAGAGIAASVAAVAILGLRFGGLGDPLPQTAQRLELVEPPSYVVPAVVSEPPLVAPVVRLTGLQYLMHHGGVASHLFQTAVHSNVIAAGEPARVRLDEDSGIDE